MTTVNPVSELGPNIVLIATSVASRPRAMTISADARSIVPGVESIPTGAEIDLEPGAEVHWSGDRRDTDIAEITGAISRRNVHASAKSDGEMRKIAANARALTIDVPSRFGRTGMLVAESDVLVNKIDNRLHASPAGRHGTEPRPGDFR